MSTKMLSSVAVLVGFVIVTVAATTAIPAAADDDDEDDSDNDNCKMSNIHVHFFQNFLTAGATDSAYHAGIGSLMDQGVMFGSDGE